MDLETITCYFSALLTESSRFYADLRKILGARRSFMLRMPSPETSSVYYKELCLPRSSKCFAKLARI